jgi:hypothetical protein
VGGYAEFAGQIAAGTLRVLAVSAPTRIAGIDAPTLREQGVALELANWRGVVAPPGVSESERERLIARVERMAASPQWKAALAKNGWQDLFLSGAPFRQFLLAEQQRIEHVLRTLDSSTPPGGPRRLSPQVAPRIALAGTAVLMAGVLVRRSGARRPGIAGNRNALAATGLMLALVVHAVAMPVTGFVPAGAALFVVAARLLGSHRLLLDTVIGVAGSAAVFVLFTRGLGLAL